MMTPVYYSTFYPGDIRLERNRWFRMTLRGKPVVVCLPQRVIGVRITDLANAVLTETDREFTTYRLRNAIGAVSPTNVCALVQAPGSDERRIVLVDFESHNHRIIAESTFTEIMVGYDSDREPAVPADAFFSVVLEEFIDMYRYVTKDVTIARPYNLSQERLVVKESLEHNRSLFTGDEFAQLESVTGIRYGIKSFTTFDRTEGTPASPEAIAGFTLRLSKLLEENTSVPPEYIHLVNAFDELVVRRNAKHAFLEAFITAEAVAGRALRVLKLARGVSKKKLDEYASEVSISYMLNVEVPAFVEQLTEAERATIGRVNGLRRIRNDIVHNGRQVSEDEAADAVNVVQTFIAIFSSRQLLHST
jgi:hypothetical protein